MIDSSPPKPRAYCLSFVNGVSELIRRANLVASFVQ